MKKIFISFILILFSQVITSFNNPEPSPDVEKFGRLFLEKLITGDTSFYKNNFSVREADLTFVLDRIKYDPYYSEYKKEQLDQEIAGKISETLEYLDKKIADNDEMIQKWIRDEKIILSNLKYIKTYYTLEYSYEPNVPYMKHAQVYIKHDTTIYEFQFDDTIYLNGKWLSGKLYRIAAMNPYLQFDYSGYNSNKYYEEDPAIAIDTTAVPDTVTSVPVEEVKFSKKEEKIYKKIGKHQKKIDELYQELYK